MAVTYHRSKQRHENEAHKKVGAYLGEEVTGELEAESCRLERSHSWLLIRAWLLSRGSIRELGTVPSVDADDESEAA
jgi:uncharacterized small protein (TIGR04563 family)